MRVSTRHVKVALLNGRGDIKSDASAGGEEPGGWSGRGANGEVGAAVGGVAGGGLQGFRRRPSHVHLWLPAHEKLSCSKKSDVEW